MRTGNPVIVDPAIYYRLPRGGIRDAATVRLVSRRVSTIPTATHFRCPAGWQRRASVYVLYHLLNHLNLFGSGYHGQCETLAADILRH